RRARDQRGLGPCLVTFPFSAFTCASRFAVEALTESFRYELSQLGVEVVLVQPSAYPTPRYFTAQRPGDACRSAEYGHIGEIAGKLFAHFMTVFEAPNAPNPHDVAEAIVGLTAQPKGQRPVRTVIGAPFGADCDESANRDCPWVPPRRLLSRLTTQE